MRFILSALRRLCERRFWPVHAATLLPYLGCVLIYLFVDAELYSDYRSPGFTAWIVWYTPYIYGFLFICMGVEHEIKARRAQREEDEQDGKE